MTAEQRTVLLLSPSGNPQMAGKSVSKLWRLSSAGRWQREWEEDGKEWGAEASGSGLSWTLRLPGLF